MTRLRNISCWKTACRKTREETMATSHDGPRTKGEDEKVHEIAGGWITERVGTPIPVFLKIAYVGFCLFGLIYLFIYRFGEVDHATRGPLVQQLNQVAD